MNPLRMRTSRTQAHFKLVSGVLQGNWTTSENLKRSPPFRTVCHASGDCVAGCLRDQIKYALGGGGGEDFVIEIGTGVGVLSQFAVRNEREYEQTNAVL